MLGCNLWEVQFIITLKIDRSIDPISAAPNPVTINPGTMYAVSISNSAFIMNVNSPKVRIFIGSVNTRINGLINTLINPITKAAIKAAPIPVIDMPGIIQATKANDKASKIQRITIFILSLPLFELLTIFTIYKFFYFFSSENLLMFNNSLASSIKQMRNVF